jgi:hypothetical protein
MARTIVNHGMVSSRTLPQVLLLRPLSLRLVTAEIGGRKQYHEDAKALRNTKTLLPCLWQNSLKEQGPQELLPGGGDAVFGA